MTKFSSMAFYLSGSTPSDFPQLKNVSNPLPDCPNVSNCTRTTIKIDDDPDKVLTLSKNILIGMNADRVRTLIEDDRLSAVFKVLFFKDDFDVQVEDGEGSVVYVHIRSASRIGFGDFGVNRRRVQRFIDALQKVTG